MILRRSALLLIGVATMASFAAGWWAGALAKPQPIQRATQVAGTLESSKLTATDAAESPKAPATAAPGSPKVDVYQAKVLPFVKKYCLACHNGKKSSGGLSLEGYHTEASARKGRRDWEAAGEQLAMGMMPPKKRKLQPTKEEREFVLHWITDSLMQSECGGTRDPGRVTIRRLNRAEYNNTIRDLCGVDFKPAEDFPADDVGYGFDNIGDVLSFQPILLEKYMAAADKILNTALRIPAIPSKDLQVRRPQQIRVVPRAFKQKGSNKIVFTSEGTASLPEQFNFPAEGDYIIRFQGWGAKAGNEFPKVVIRLDGKDLKTFTVDAEERKPRKFEVKGHFPDGGKKIAVAFINGFEDKKAKTARRFGLTRIEVEGPFNPVPKPDPDSVRLILGNRPGNGSGNQAAAKRVLENFLRRAYRRPAKADEVLRLMKLYELAVKQGEPFESAIRLPLKAVLCSPHFLYRIEDDPKDPNAIRTLNDYEFATRLSYFLWSTMPDEELFRLAAQGNLRKPEILESQVRRMLKDPKSRALSENFAGQWLMLRSIQSISPDKGYFPKWDEKLRASIVGEAEAFFEYVVRNDRPILDFLDADYTFVNGRLADHYKLKDVAGSRFRKVKLPDNRRGGIITMASTLTVTSNPTRTSPVKRGKWILENILGTPPPPPAPDVPELPPTGQLKGTLRQQMEQHRANPSCAVCHAKLDPLGFGLENFDGIGAWRTTDNKKAIDASGVLPGGVKFDGPAELRKTLLGKADQFRHCFAEKLLTFSLGRGLEYYDRCTVEDIVKSGKANRDRFTAYVLAIVKSDPFQKRKGKRSE